MAYIEFTFTVSNTDESEMIVAILDEINMEGFLEEELILKAYIKESDLDKILFENIIEQNNLKYTESVIEEENWNAKWESGFEPITVLNHNDSAVFAFVRANFHAPNPNAAHDILITPKMSFGTGHHATTLQMMEEMSKIDFKDKVVIDFGTGTGVLAILAEKLGAKSIEAIDYDDWSINNTNENIIANNCSRIKVVQADKCIETLGKADVLLANINLNVILNNISHIKNCCKIASIMLFSGILVDDTLEITTAFEKAGIKVNDIKSKNNWLLISTELLP